MKAESVLIIKIEQLCILNSEVYSRFSNFIKAHLDDYSTAHACLPLFLLLVT